MKVLVEIADDEALDKIIPAIVEVAKNDQYCLAITKCYTPGVPVVEIALFRVSEGH